MSKKQNTATKNDRDAFGISPTQVKQDLARTLVVTAIILCILGFIVWWSRG